MKRRQFLALSTYTVSTLAISALALSASPVVAAGTTVEFSPEVYQKALESGEPFMLDFSAIW